MTSDKAAKEFVQHQDSWWNQYTDCINFSTQAQQSRRRLTHQVQTDGVSVLMFQPFPVPSTQTATAAAAAPPGRKRKRSSRAAAGEWV
ncbi:TPA: hypothetical protein ACH3X1_010287 [Trebouxia sp. C0004]